MSVLCSLKLSHYSPKLLFVLLFYPHQLNPKPSEPVLHTLFFFSSRRRHTRWPRDWSSDVCSSDLVPGGRLVLAPGRLGQVPDVLVPAGQFVHVSIDPLPGGLLGRTGQLSRTGQLGAHVSSSASNNDNGTCSRCTPPAPIASCNASGRSAAARIEVPVPPNAVTSAAQSGWSRRTPIGGMPRSASFSSISRYPPLSTHTTTRSRSCSRAVMNSCTENISAPSPSTHTTGRWGLAIFAPIEAGNPYPRVA